MPLVFSKLENIQYLSGGAIRAGCPACILKGGDPRGVHLYVNANGAYGCAANKGDKEHTKEIFRLVGTNNPDPDEIERQKEQVYQKPNVEIETFFEEKDLARLIPDNSYWHGRGITDETLSLFRGGLSRNNKMSGRYCFPIFSETGRIHGITGRWTLSIETELNWKHLGATSLWIYPYFFNKEIIRELGWVVIVESVGDMLKLWQAGIRNVLVLFGSSISQSLLAKLVGLDLKKIFVSTNNDTHNTAGQVAAATIKRKLDIFYDGVAEICLPPEKDFGVMKEENILKWAKDKYVIT